MLYIIIYIYSFRHIHHLCMIVHVWNSILHEGQRGRPWQDAKVVYSQRVIEVESETEDHLPQQGVDYREWFNRVYMSVCNISLYLYMYIYICIYIYIYIHVIHTYYKICLHPFFNNKDEPIHKCCHPGIIEGMMAEIWKVLPSTFNL